nr:MAG TPA: hypothetical protein [Caudoviricetes sp.]
MAKNNAKPPPMWGGRPGWLPGLMMRAERTERP